MRIWNDAHKTASSQGLKPRQLHDNNEHASKSETNEAPGACVTMQKRISILINLPQEIDNGTEPYGHKFARIYAPVPQHESILLEKYQQIVN